MPCKALKHLKLLQESQSLLSHILTFITVLAEVKMDEVGLFCRYCASKLNQENTSRMGESNIKINA